MKLLIFGATGPTGQHLVEQALEQGHEVTAYVRNPDKLKIQNPKLKVLKGEISDEAAIQKALSGQDAVLSALGVGQTFKSNGLMTKSVKAIVAAMEKTGTKRLIWLSAFGVGEYKKEAPLIPKIFFSTLLRDVFADKKQSEETLRSSKLDWTLAYPTVLTNGPKTQKYRVGEHLKLSGVPKISRADTADSMLKLINDKTYIKKVAVISY